MPFEVPKFKPEEYDVAGQILGSDVFTKEDEVSHDWALEVVDNWRAASSFVLGAFAIQLPLLLKNFGDKTFNFQRLKRAESIERKLRRDFRGTSLTLRQIQDIAGCRIVFDSLEKLREFAAKYYGSDRIVLFHGVKENDYIKNPKPDGYRGHHLVYEFQSDFDEWRAYNGMRLELQLRTLTDHYWATAVEAVDFVTGQELKFGKGDPDWRRFFALMGAVFACLDKTGRVRGTPKVLPELIAEVRQLFWEQNIQTLLLGLRDPAEQKIEKSAPDAFYRLLTLDTLNELVTVREYSKSETEQALQEYGKAERETKALRQYNVVLVRVDSLRQLREAYPNYYLDIEFFYKFTKHLTMDAV